MHNVKIACLCGEIGRMREGEDPDPCPKCFISQAKKPGKLFVEVKK